MIKKSNIFIILFDLIRLFLVIYLCREGNVSKKNYQINVIDAENIKKQNNPEQISENQPVQEKPQELKTGLMIGGLIAFFLALCFMAFTIYYVFQTYSSDNDAQKVITFIVFILSIGWISYIPGVICSIISLCLHPFVIKSTSKIQKAIGIIFTILSILLILAFLVIAIYIIALPNN